jgi:murein DD-endopeptidase MepM/ murein hydrolase activator NlpD
MISRTRMSLVRLVSSGVIVFVFALPGAEAKACNSSKLAARNRAESSGDPPTKARKFLWPVPGGHIVVSLCGWRNEGIDFAMPAGVRIRAVEAGVVAYAGDELKGYGHLIIIRHANGFVSAYAHVPNPQVNRGDQVSRGQTIGAVGTRPNDEPLLHFELHKGVKAVDAERYLEDRRAPPAH